MKQSNELTVLSIILVTAGITLLQGWTISQAAQTDHIRHLNSRIVAINMPGASAISQIGTFLNVPPPGACANPIPTKFPSYILPGAILDPSRILVGSRSNFGAPRAIGVGGLVPVDRSERATCPERPREFCEDRRPGIDAGRGGANVQRQQPALAEQCQ